MNFAGRCAAEAMVIAVIGASAAAGTYFVTGPPSRLFFCDPAQLQQGEVCLRDLRREDNLLWVDARSRKEWKENGLEGSMLWSLSGEEDPVVFEAELANRAAQTPDVIVYCGGEDCSLSHQVAEMIRKMDLGIRVRVLKGGWRALDEAGWIKDSNSGS